MYTPKLVIAVDGTSASGKGTLAQKIADYYSLAYLDTGLIYRAVGMRVIRDGGNVEDPAVVINAAEMLRIDDLNASDLRGGEAAEAASKAAKIPKVREVLLQMQRDFAYHPPQGKRGSVLDGRDIGTVICPDAPVKFYIDAKVDVRAQRRFDQLKGLGENISYAEVLSDLKRRDERDSTRAAAPLKPAPDAIILDTSTLSVEEVFAAAKKHIDSVLDIL